MSLWQTLLKYVCLIKYRLPMFTFVSCIFYSKSKMSLVVAHQESKNLFSFLLQRRSFCSDIYLRCPLSRDCVELSITDKHIPFIGIQTAYIGVIFPSSRHESVMSVWKFWDFFFFSWIEEDKCLLFSHWRTFGLVRRWLWEDIIAFFFNQLNICWVIAHRRN